LQEATIVLCHCLSVILTIFARPAPYIALQQVGQTEVNNLLFVVQLLCYLSADGALISPPAAML
jgi:hypothetical protein